MQTHRAVSILTSEALIHLTFEEPAIPNRITITFQGGWVGTKFRVEVSWFMESMDMLEWQTWTHIHSRM